MHFMTFKIYCSCVSHKCVRIQLCHLSNMHAVLVLKSSLTISKDWVITAVFSRAMLWILVSTAATVGWSLAVISLWEHEAHGYMCTAWKHPPIRSNKFYRVSNFESLTKSHTEALATLVPISVQGLFFDYFLR